jgi:high-affinity Fe2+/Pb2+ permease
MKERREIWPYFLLGFAAVLLLLLGLYAWITWDWSNAARSAG